MKNGIYESFAELASDWKIKPIKNKKDNNDSLKNKFNNKHTCPACKQPLSYISGTNIMSCKNVSCKGIKDSRTDKDGNQINVYYPSFHILDDTGKKIANSIYKEES